MPPFVQHLCRRDAILLPLSHICSNSLLYYFFPFLAHCETKGNQLRYYNNHQILVILIVTYSFLFFYDLIQFGTLDEDSQLNCTQTQNIKVFNQYGHQETILQLTYVFQHWSRPFSAFIRNIFCLGVILKKKIPNHDLNTDLSSKVIPYWSICTMI